MRAVEATAADGRRLAGAMAWPRHGQRFNTYSHVLGLLVMLGSGLLLLPGCNGTCDAGAFAGVAVFLATAVLLFLCSVMCHASRGRLQRAWQRADHAATFLLIAGSYTPFALAPARHGVALVVLAGIWAAALALTIRELVNRGNRAPPLIAYVALGWTSVAAAIPIALQAGWPTLSLLLAGAALYSVGTVFYRNTSGWTHAHGVWHLLVLAGAATHAAAVGRLAVT